MFGASLVAATTSTPKVEFVKSLGADVVIDYKKEKFEDLPEKYDVVFDGVGMSKLALVYVETGKEKSML